MTITYNKNKLNTMDFSLDGEIGIAKFDFVTVALRDIAIGLGFTSNITANSSTKMINMTGEKYTPFESLIVHPIRKSYNECNRYKSVIGLFYCDIRVCRC